MLKILSLLLLSLLAFHANATEFSQPGRLYDEQGIYQGRMDANGRMYDRSGRYIGRKDANGRSYDNQGRYTGR